MADGELSRILGTSALRDADDPNKVAAVVNADEAPNSTKYGMVARVVGMQTSLGSVTETAPATDTASSGLNGRLQRIAQRITSLIALLPTSLGGAGGLKIEGTGTAGTPAGGVQTVQTPEGGVTTTKQAQVVGTGASASLVSADPNRRLVRLSSTKTNSSAAIDPTGGTCSLDFGEPIEGGDIREIWGKEAQQAMTFYGAAGNKFTLVTG